MLTHPLSAADLKRMANQIRSRDLQMIHHAGIGHAGGDLSATDVLATLYFHVMRVDPQHPDWPDRDRFILSKGHASGALYTTLALAGFFPEEDLTTFAAALSKLNGHPDRNKVPGIETNTGALGHGLPIAVGLGLAAKHINALWRVFVLCGDGELQEGSNWEAIMAASQFRLDNLVLIVDRNRLQQGNGTEHTIALDPLPAKFEAFGWRVVTVDGHDHKMLVDTLNQVPLSTGQPTCLVAETHKGQGVSFMQDRVAWHHRVPNDQELRQALEELSHEHAL